VTGFWILLTESALISALERKAKSTLSILEDMGCEMFILFDYIKSAARKDLKQLPGARNQPPCYRSKLSRNLRCLQTHLRTAVDGEFFPRKKVQKVR